MASRKKKSTLLVPYDGSDCAQRALAFAFQRFQAGGYDKVVALNVQVPMPTSNFVTHEMIEEYHSQAAEEALTSARKLAARLKLPLVCATAVDVPATAIAGFARKSQGDEIIMGTHGRGRVGGLLLGSTATKVVHLADVPVTLVK